MVDLLAGLVLVGASFGVAAVLGSLVWCWMKLSPRYRKSSSRW
jgi:hypothetical protein